MKKHLGADKKASIHSVIVRPIDSENRPGDVATDLACYQNQNSQVNWKGVPVKGFYGTQYYELSNMENKN